MADDQQVTIPLLTATAASTAPGVLSFYATKDTANNYTMQSTPRVNGAQVDSTNPMPVMDAAVAAALALIEAALAGTLTVKDQPVASVYSVGLEASHVLKAAPGTLYGFQVNYEQSGYVMLFDAATVPADGAVVPRKAWQVNASAGGTLDKTFSPPLALTQGAVLVFSTAGPFTKAASASAQFSGEVA